MYRAKKDKKEFHISEDQVKVYEDAGYTVEEINGGTPSGETPSGEALSETVEPEKKTKVK